MINHYAALFFHIDTLAIIMMTLIAYIALCVSSFSWRYMKGDRKYVSFFIKLLLLVISLFVMISADHLMIFLIAWWVSNILLVTLMIHKSRWKAARASGILAAKNFVVGSLCITLAFGLFYYITGETSIQRLISEHAASTIMLPALLLLLIGGMSQSAIYPFHRWLTSSLNSPTPVSAIMHAGLVNGGGFLLCRFAPLFLEHSNLLTLIFVIGIVTALMGTLWKLMQSDVKRMLACSTMGQMGFMLAQCGLGLFPLAVAHLVWHGMFKAHLFLASGSTSQEKRFVSKAFPKPVVFICALFCGFSGSLGFGLASGKSWLFGDTTIILMIVAFLSGTQLALTILGNKPLRTLPMTFIAVAILGGLYGLSVYLIAWVMEPMQLMRPQSLNIFHIVGAIALLLAWLSFMFLYKYIKAVHLPEWILRAHMKALNASQPHPETVTSHRNYYTYK